VGEANARGSLADRRDAAIMAGAEIIISLTAKDGKVSASFMPRDEVPDQASHAVIFAGYLATNFNNLVAEAMQLYHRHMAEQQAQAQDPKIITDRQPRSITDEAGNVIRSTDDVNLVIPGGISSPFEFKQLEPEAVQSGGGGEFAGGGASADYDASQQDFKYEPPDAAPSSSEPAPAAPVGEGGDT
jgi:hypothetical protein